LHQPAQEFGQRRGIRIEIDEDELLPGLHPDGNQSILRAIEPAHTFKLGRALQRAVEAIAPAMVRTAQNTGLSLLLGDDRSGVVPAHVVEGAQLAVAAAYDDQRLARK